MPDRQDGNADALGKKEPYADQHPEPFREAGRKKAEKQFPARGNSEDQQCGFELNAAICRHLTSYLQSCF